MIHPVQEFPCFLPTIIYCIFLLHIFPLLDFITLKLDGNNYLGSRQVQREGQYHIPQSKLKIYKQGLAMYLVSNSLLIK